MIRLCWKNYHPSWIASKLEEVTSSCSLLWNLWHVSQSHEVGFFKKTNYKTQTISLVSKHFKLISFITIRVQWTQFNCYGENMEIEFNELGFHVKKPSSLNSIFHKWKTSSKNSFSIHGKRSCTTRNWFANNKLIRRRSDKVHLLQTQPNIRWH